MSIPVHPQPGIFETTVVEVGGNLVGHLDIEAILEAPAWTFADALAQVEARLRRPCPTCGATGPCVTASGRTALKPHAGRYTS